MIAFIIGFVVAFTLTQVAMQVILHEMRMRRERHRKPIRRIRD